MRDIDDRATASCDGPGHGPRRLRPEAIRAAIRAAIPGAIIAAALFGLAACVPMQDATPETPGGVEPPMAVKPVPGPVALAPGMTGSAPAPAPTHPAAPSPAPMAVPAAAHPAAPSPAPMAVPAAAHPAAPSPA